jgi:hypothetical protein
VFAVRVLAVAVAVALAGVAACRVTGRLVAEQPQTLAATITTAMAPRSPVDVREFLTAL